MSLTYGFYNAVGNDRVYDAVQLSQMFNGIITDGVFKLVGNKFLVTQNSGMGIICKSGKAWFKNTWTLNDGDLDLTVTPSDLILPRIDTVALEVNTGVGVRANAIKVIAGTPNATPVAATLTHTAELNQYPLAYVLVGVGVTSIVDANITQVVGTVECPYILFPEPLIAPSDAADVLKVQIFT
jgi:hypothetical protein